MPARLLFLIALILLSCRSSVQTRKLADRIDSLHTDQDVLNFVRWMGPPKFEYTGLVFQPPLLKDVAVNSYHAQYLQRIDSFGAKAYEKTDLDGNGFTDLLFNGYDVHRGWFSMAILFFGKDSFLIRELPKELSPEFFAARSIHIDGEPCLQTLTELYSGQDALERQCDTLIWVNSWPVERRPHLRHSVDTLRYSQSSPFGIKGNFQLTLVKDSLLLEKTGGLSPSTPIDSGGIFIARLDSATTRALYSVIAAIDWELLDNEYHERANDLCSGDFQFQYDHGKTKTVFDYGLIGTYGLSSLEELLFGFLKSESWKRIGPGGSDYLFLHDRYLYTTPPLQQN